MLRRQCVHNSASCATSARELRGKYDPGHARGEANKQRLSLKAARAIHHRLMPLMSANFVEANPVPVKAAMAIMGLIEETYRLPLVPSKPESKEKAYLPVSRCSMRSGPHS